MIQSFAKMSFDARLHFAEEMIKKINSESIFLNGTKFKIDQIELDDYSDDLIILTTSVDPVKLSRGVFWQVPNEDYLYYKPKSMDYIDTEYEAVSELLKTKTAVVDGYTVTAEIDDVEAGKNIEVQVDSYYHDDNGIGYYDFWGEPGYDSRPFIVVEGTATEEREVAISFYVSPKAE